jgi:hypothetical protein
VSSRKQPNGLLPDGITMVFFMLIGLGVGLDSNSSSSSSGSLFRGIEYSPLFLRDFLFSPEMRFSLEENDGRTMEQNQTGAHPRPTMSNNVLPPTPPAEDIYSDSEIAINMRIERAAIYFPTQHEAIGRQFSPGPPGQSPQSIVEIQWQMDILCPEPRYPFQTGRASVDGTEDDEIQPIELPPPRFSVIPSPMIRHNSQRQAYGEDMVDNSGHEMGWSSGDTERILALSPTLEQNNRPMSPFPTDRPNNHGE